jgi:hypothetical protein
MLRERTRSGLDAARKQDRVGPKLKTNQPREMAHMADSGQKTSANAEPDYSTSIQLPCCVSSFVLY